MPSTRYRKLASVLTDEEIETFLRSIQTKSNAPSPENAQLLVDEAQQFKARLARQDYDPPTDAELVAAIKIFARRYLKGQEEFDKFDQLLFCFYQLKQKIRVTPLDFVANRKRVKQELPFLTLVETQKELFRTQETLKELYKKLETLEKETTERIKTLEFAVGKLAALQKEKQSRFDELEKKLKE